MDDYIIVTMMDCKTIIQYGVANGSFVTLLYIPTVFQKAYIFIYLYSFIYFIFYLHVRIKIYFSFEKAMLTV